MYLHCHNCDWSQDDFWDKSYNPIRYLLDWEENLLEKFDEDFPGELDTKGMTYGDVIAREVDRAAITIRSMMWYTYEDWKKDKAAGTAKCPNCSSSEHFDTD